MGSLAEDLRLRSTSPTRWVNVRWPAEFKMTMPEFAQRSSLRARPLNGDTWSVATDEGYLRRAQPNLLRHKCVLYPTATPNDLLFFARWDRVDLNRSRDPRVDDEHRRLRSAPELSLSRYGHSAQLGFQSEPRDSLPGFVEHGLLRPLQQPLPHARLLIIDYDQAIHSRVSLARSILTAREAPDWLANIGSGGFSVMRGLGGRGLNGGSTFIDVLLAAQFPWVFGISVARTGAGLGVVLFGDVLPWRSDPLDYDLGELLRASDLLQGGPTIRMPKTPTFDATTVEAAVRWWIAAADRLIGVATDPTLYATSGEYDAAQHLGSMLSMERLFASVLAGLTSTGLDEYSRRLHLFEALDILGELLRHDYEVLLDEERLRAVLDELQDTLPEAVSCLVLPRCRAAVDGLVELQKGFLASRRVGDSVELKSANGTDRRVPVRKAVARLLREVRNAGHGFESILDDPRHLSLLTAHDVDIPSAVSDVAFLHLVRFMASPDLLVRARLKRAARQPSR